MNNKAKVALLSRTNWTTVATFVYWGFDSIREVVPAEWQGVVGALLAGLALYFRINTKAESRVK